MLEMNIYDMNVEKECLLFCRMLLVIMGEFMVLIYIILFVLL